MNGSGGLAPPRPGRAAREAAVLLILAAGAWALRWAASERSALATTEGRAASAAALSWSSNRIGLSFWRMCHST